VRTASRAGRQRFPGLRWRGMLSARGRRWSRFHAVSELPSAGSRCGPRSEPACECAELPFAGPRGGRVGLCCPDRCWVSPTAAWQCGRATGGARWLLWQLGSAVCSGRNPPAPGPRGKRGRFVEPRPQRHAASRAEEFWAPSPALSTRSRVLGLGQLRFGIQGYRILQTFRFFKCC